MASLTELWKKDSSLLAGKAVPQVVAICGDGKLRDDNHTSKELRELLSHVPGDILTAYADQCLAAPFTESGLVLQDIINQIGVRLGFAVTAGRYRGTVNQLGYDGIWKSKDEHCLILEVKTTDTYRINQPRHDRPIPRWPDRAGPSF